MTVTPTDEPLCFHVESATNDGLPYMVDLTQRVDTTGRAHGVCSCIYFQTKANPNYRKSPIRIPYRPDKSGKIDSRTTECKHIAAANAYDHWHTTMIIRASIGAGTINVGDTVST